MITLRHPLATICGAIAVAATLTLVGCQTASVSTTEALEIAGSFKGTGFEAPPKSVDDILQQLAAASRDGQQRLSDAQARLSEPEPAGLDAQARAKWLFARARAAHLVGDMSSELAAYREARDVLDTSTRSGETFKFLIYFELARTELLGGNFSDAMAAMDRAPDLITVSSESSGGQSFAPIPLLGYQSLVLANIGDLERATVTRDDVEDRYSREAVWFNEWPREGVLMVRASRDAARGAVAKASGDLQAAEALYRTAIDDFSVYKDFQVSRYIDYDRAILDMFYQTLQLELADVLRRQGRLAEAEAQARGVLTEALSTHGRYSAHTASVLRDLTTIILEQGRLSEAVKLADASLETLDMAGVGETSLARARAQLIRAAALGADGDWDGALDAYDVAESALKGDLAAIEAYLAANPERGIAKLFGGAPDEAQAIFRRAADRATKRVGAEAYETQELQGLAAVADAYQGRTGQARDGIARVVEPLLAGMTGGEQENLFVREWRRRLVLETYLDLITRDTPDRAALAESFRIGTTLGRGLVERTIALSGARTAADPAAAALLREQQDANLRLGALNDQISATLAAGGDVDALRGQADQLRLALSALSAEIETNHPDLAELINPKPLDLDAATAMLRPEEALIVTYFGRDRGYVWTLRADGTANLHSTALSNAKIRAMVDELRIALDPMPRTLADIPPYDVALGYDLYSQLLAPSQNVWGDAHDLVVAAHGPLGFLPLAVLPTEATGPSDDGGVPFAGYRDVAWLTRSHGVAVIPSAGTLRTLRGHGSSTTAGTAFVGFGDPVFDPAKATTDDATQVAAATPQNAANMRSVPVALRALPSIELRNAQSADLTVLPRLPDTADELRAIAAAMGTDADITLHLRQDAGEDVVMSTDFTPVGTVAFATHGLIPGDLDGLTQPALALTHPALRGGRGDGLLGADEILGLSLNADWIVLSACNTGSGDGRGAEAVSGLGRSFFYAGARALLVSNWPVHSQSATALTSTLFATYRDGQTSKAQALRTAMTDLIDGPGFTDANGNALFSYAHPLFWGPFSVVGSPAP